ncbi:hypothetical protein [Streptomyces sp. NPDC007083]|uniref:hypothetical protein n=1 Tax=Streptomyces sp. NPDC007083 TaxID=3156913 RepID=UPI0033E288A9
MTDNNDPIGSNTGQPDADTTLPKFPVNVVPIGSLQNQHIRAALDRYRVGDNDPLIIGDGDTPEAVLIPFAAFVRLMKHDHATYVRAEDAFQAGLSRRIEDSDARRTAGERDTTLVSDEDFDAWVEGNFGELGRDWVRNKRASQEGAGGD